MHTAKLLDEKYTIDDMPNGAIIWYLVKKNITWLLGVYSLTATCLLVLPTAIKVLHFFGV